MDQTPTATHGQGTPASSNAPGHCWQLGQEPQGLSPSPSHGQKLHIGATVSSARSASYLSVSSTTGRSITGQPPPAGSIPIWACTAAARDTALRIDRM